MYQCKGLSYSTNKKIIEIPLVKGIEQGQKIQVKGKGHPKEYQTDLILIIIEKNIQFLKEKEMIYG